MIFVFVFHSIKCARKIFYAFSTTTKLVLQSHSLGLAAKALTKACKLYTRCFVVVLPTLLLLNSHARTFVAKIPRLSATAKSPSSTEDRFEPRLGFEPQKPQARRLASHNPASKCQAKSRATTTQHSTTKKLQK